MSDYVSKYCTCGFANGLGDTCLCERKQPSSEAQPEVKRYACIPDFEGDRRGEMMIHPDGDYVLLSEHEQKVASLAGELERVKQERDEATEFPEIVTAAKNRLSKLVGEGGLLPQISRVEKLAAELSKEQERAQKWERALVGLTPGGSEFIGDPERCVEAVRSTRDSMMGAMQNHAKIRREAEAKLSAAREALEKLRASAFRKEGVTEEWYCWCETCSETREALADLRKGETA